MRTIWNLLAVSGTTPSLGARTIVRAYKARAELLEVFQGCTIWGEVPPLMTGLSPNGLLLLDRSGLPRFAESIRDGKSNTRCHMDIWPEGEKRNNRYAADFEQFARVDWPAAIGDGRAVFSLNTSAEVGEELAMRTLVDTEEISALSPESLLIRDNAHHIAGELSLLPAAIPVDGRKIYVKSVIEGVVTKVTKDHLVVKGKDKKYRSFPVPEGMAPHSRVRVGRRISKGQALFRFDVDVDGLSKLDIAGAIVAALEAKMFVENHGQKLVRLRYAEGVAHWCLRCGHNNGIMPVAELTCPDCGKEMVSPRTEDGDHLKAAVIKPDTILECTKCKASHTSEEFRAHRRCRACGAAAAPALKKAYIMANARFYESPSLALGKNMQAPQEITHVQKFLRRITEEGGSLADLAESAKIRTRLPELVHVA